MFVKRVGIKIVVNIKIVLTVLRRNWRWCFSCSTPVAAQVLATVKDLKAGATPHQSVGNVKL
jgi:hypothetical protein